MGNLFAHFTVSSCHYIVVDALFFNYFSSAKLSVRNISIELFHSACACFGAYETNDCHKWMEYTIQWNLSITTVHNSPFTQFKSLIGTIQPLERSGTQFDWNAWRFEIDKSHKFTWINTKYVNNCALNRWKQASLYVLFCRRMTFVSHWHMGNTKRSPQQATVSHVCVYLWGRMENCQYVSCCNRHQ